MAGPETAAGPRRGPGPDVHELSIANEIVAVAERTAGGLPVAVVRVKVGRLRQVVPEYLDFYFEAAARGTVCEGAAMEWERLPSLLRCDRCATEWDPAPAPARTEDELLVDFRCPGCRSGLHSVVSGDELLVESIDVEDPDPPEGRGPGPEAGRKASPAPGKGGG